MLGHLMLAKLLHCKLHRKKKLICKESDDDSTNRMPAESIPIKKELAEQDEIQATCRVCLKFGDIPIYGSEDMSEALSSFGAITINQDDKYPKYLCQYCYSLLQSAILFRKSAQKSDVILRKPHKDTCDIEDARYSDGNDSEYENIHTEDTKVYHCQKCNIDFDTFKDYSEHRLSQEHENIRHTCPICKKSYTSLYYKRHLALHKLETPYMCDICGKKFIVQGQFTRHRVTHFYNLPFKCSLCPYKGRFSESLKMHMRTHTGEKPYQCAQCPSRFVNKSNLNKHMLTHKGNHDFKCDTCGRGFYTKRDLDLHFKVDHTGIKDHVCNICGKAFGYRKQMMKHQLKVHKRQKLKSGRMPLYMQLESKSQD